MTSEFQRTLHALNSSKAAAGPPVPSRPPKPSRSRKSSSSQDASKDSRTDSKDSRTDPKDLKKTDSLRNSLTGITLKLKPQIAQVAMNAAQGRKKLLDVLKDATEPLPLLELGKRAGIDLEGSTTAHFVTWLQSSERVIHARGKYTYRPLHEIKDREQLLQFLRRTPEGTGFNDIKDSYRTVGDDVRALQAAGKIYVVFNHDLQQDVMYPVDESLEHLRVDEDLVQLWRSTKVPVNTTELQAAIKNAGIKTADFAPPVAKREAPSQQKRKAKRYRQQRVVTNVHMPELHQGPQPDQID